MTHKIIAGFALALAFAAFGCTVPVEPQGAAAANTLGAPQDDDNQLNSNPGDFCGGIAGIQCDSGFYCKYEPEQCGVADAGGTCQVQPTACTKQYDPVCGCDGQTYGNACMAAFNGASVAYEGECSSGGGGNEGDICGGFAGLQCASGLYCNFPPKTKCGSGDQAGVCAEPPDVCPRIYAPVCGCDGNTYGNACVAASNSVSVLHKGPCQQ